MKRILCVTESLGSGGAERQLVGLAVLLKQAGYDVKFITYVRRQFYENYLKQNNVNYELLEKAGNKYTRVLYWARAIRQFAPDVVISFLPSTSMSVALTKLLGLKFKLIVSERSHTSCISLRVRLKFLLYRLADYIVTNSYSEADFTRANFLWTADRLNVVTNFIDTERFKPLEIKRANMPVKIISVGRVIPCKNILNYMRAIKLAVDRGYHLKVVWVGDNYDASYYNECLELRGKLELKDYFEFKPQTENIIDEYQKADIFCLPSFYEGFPNVVCEAMGCGLPVICSNVCDNPIIVINGENGILFNPNNVDHIFESIISIISDSEQLERMSINNRLKAIAMFSKIEFMEQYTKLIDKKWIK